MAEDPGRDDATPYDAAPERAVPEGAAPTQPAVARLRRTNAGRIWITVGVATAVLVLLIVFIAQNSRAVTVSFLGANGHIALGLAMLIAAVVGAAVALLAGTVRILELRREVRRHRRARAAERLTSRER